MAQKLKGVGGVLGGLISPEPPQLESPATATDLAPEIPTVEPVRTDIPEQPAPIDVSENPRRKAKVQIGARRGRPPGRKVGESTDKEKVTLRITKELMDDYREWSWEERCQLGELVERALSQYRKQHSRQKSRE